MVWIQKPNNQTLPFKEGELKTEKSFRLNTFNYIFGNCWGLDFKQYWKKIQHCYYCIIFNAYNSPHLSVYRMIFTKHIQTNIRPDRIRYVVIGCFTAKKCTSPCSRQARGLQPRHHQRGRGHRHGGRHHWCVGHVWAVRFFQGSYFIFRIVDCPIYIRCGYSWNREMENLNIYRTG